MCRVIVYYTEVCAFYTFTVSVEVKHIGVCLDSYWDPGQWKLIVRCVIVKCRGSLCTLGLKCGCVILETCVKVANGCRGSGWTDGWMESGWWMVGMGGGEGGRDQGRRMGGRN